MGCLRIWVFDSVDITCFGLLVLMCLMLFVTLVAFCLFMVCCIVRLRFGFNCLV